MNPGRKCGISPKTRQLVECPNERVLRELTSQIRIARQPKRESVDPGRVRVVQLARGDPVTGKNLGDQLGSFTRFAAGRTDAIEFT